MAILRQCLMQVRMHHHQWDVPFESWPDPADGSVAGFPVALGVDPLIARGLSLVGRSAGVLAHILEKKQQPMAREAWQVVLCQDPRNELP